MQKVKSVSVLHLNLGRILKITRWQQRLPRQYDSIGNLLAESTTSPESGTDTVMPLYEMTPDAFRPISQVVVQEVGMSELHIDRGSAEENKQVLHQLHAPQSQVEKAFGGPLSWERLDTKLACRIKHFIACGDYRSPESQWPAIQSAMVDVMIRLEAALKASLALSN